MSQTSENQREIFQSIGGLNVRYLEISKEIDMVISNREKNKIGRKYHDPKKLYTDFKTAFAKFGYAKEFLSLKKQLKYPARGNGKQMDYSKVCALKVQFGKYSFMFYGMSKFQQACDENLINVRIEIVATCEMNKEMSGGVSYEEQLVNDITVPHRHYPSALVKIIMIEP